MNPDHLCPQIRGTLKPLPPPHENHDGVVPPPPPRDAMILGPIAALHTRAIRAMAEVDALSVRLDPYLVSRLLVRREAVSSSAIEGTNSTLDELLSVETGHEAGTSDTRQVRDYVEILSRYIREAQAAGPDVFQFDLLRNIHAAVMRADASYRDGPGELRTTSVWIGSGGIANSTWNAPPAEDVQRCLGQTLDYMRDAGRQQATQDVITRIAVAHSHFEAVHPFRDGNGRVGRILIPLMMAAEGHTPLYLAPYIEAHRGGYLGALRKSQQQLDWIAMIAFLCEAIVGTVDHLKETVQRVEALAAGWRARRRFRKNAASERALAILVSHPVITITRLSELLGVTYPQAATAVDQLVAANILVERTGYKRNRVFAASEVLAIVDRRFADGQYE